MTEIILVRHGETDWNAARRLQGHTDIALNARGRQQAAALAAALSAEAFDAIYSSDLERAHDTAQAVASTRNMTVTTKAGLRERCYGGFEGVLHQELPILFPDAYAAFLRRDVDARYPDSERRAETLREFFDRCVETVSRLAQAHCGQKILVVAHGGVLECLYRAARKIDLQAPRDFDIQNATINRLSWDGQVFQIEAWSQVTHLDQKSLDEVS
ncbi:MAG: histidine phosphatase family protein [Janthinobacterium lividum]